MIERMKGEDAMEELIEEIRLLWCEECADGPLRSEYEAEWDEACDTGAEDLCRERARKVIARILSAVRDGRLDEALGVVGRNDTYEDMDDIFDWIDGILGRHPDMVEMPPLIALRPLAETGKEEEE